MKKTIIQYMFVFVIALLLIISATFSIFAQKTSMTINNEDDLIKPYKLLEETHIRKSDISLKTDVESRSPTTKMTSISGSMKHVLSTKAEHAQAAIALTSTRGIYRAEHPAVSMEPNGAGVIAYELYDQGGTPEYALIITGEGDDCFFDCYYAPPGPPLIYWMDNHYDPIKFAYPSMHFRGYDHNGCYCFTGTAIDPYDTFSGSGYTHGGATTLFKVACDTSINSSYYCVYWNWRQYGWNMADDAPVNNKSRFPHAEHAPALFKEGSASTDWAWGINSYIMDTTYTYSGMIDDHYQTDGGFVQYQVGGEEEWSEISWYEQVGECLSTDCIIDNNANLYWNDSYSEIIDWSIPGRDMDHLPYVAYSVFDPKNETTNRHELAIRLDDWLAMSVFGWDWSIPPTYASGLWIYGDESYSIEYPCVVADRGNLIVAFEKNMIDRRNIEIWHTSDGNPGHLVKVAEINAGQGQEFRWPDITLVQEETYVGKIFYNNSIYMFITYDGGQTWDGLYTYVSDPETPIVTTPRAWDTSEYGFTTFWEWQNETNYQLFYNWDAIKYGCHAFYNHVGGTPAPLSEFTIKNIRWGNHTLLGAIDTVQDNKGWRFLLYGFDIASQPTPAILRLIAKDTEDSIGLIDKEITSIDIYQHEIYENIIVNIHYRDLIKFPYHQATIDTGAAVMKMILDYLMWNRTLDSYGPPSVYSEQTLYTNYAGGDRTNSSELCSGLNTEIDDYHHGWIYGYFFAPSAHDQPLDALKSAVIWLDYNISGSNEHRQVDVPKPGHPYHVPFAVPTGGDYDHWMVIHGIHTNRSMWNTNIPGDHDLINGPVTIYGFWINDPSSGGLGENTYVTAEYFNQTYFQQLNVPGDYYNNEYVVITDPPQNIPSLDVQNLHLTCTSPIEGFTAEEIRLVENTKRIPMFHSVGQKIYYQQAQEFGDNVLQNDPEYGPLFTDSTLHSITFRGTHCIVDFTSNDGTIRFEISLDDKTGAPEQISIL
ncbi:MAG: hypothetical protein V1726_03025 [Methanobacteriota archaeon]